MCCAPAGVEVDTHPILGSLQQGDAAEAVVADLPAGLDLATKNLTLEQRSGASDLTGTCRDIRPQQFALSFAWENLPIHCPIPPCVVVSSMCAFVDEQRFQRT
jgi:hypothetical protein